MSCMMSNDSCAFMSCGSCTVVYKVNLEGVFASRKMFRWKKIKIKTSTTKVSIRHATVVFFRWPWNGLNTSKLRIHTDTSRNKFVKQQLDNQQVFIVYASGTKVFPTLRRWQNFYHRTICAHKFHGNNSHWLLSYFFPYQPFIAKRIVSNHAYQNY